MKKLMIGTALVATAALFAAGAASAHGKGEGKGDRMEAHWQQMDKDGDGELSKEELTGRASHLLEDADADGNGKISKDEMKAFHEARRAEWKEKHNKDKNGDGVVDRTEFLNAAQEHFDKLDKDGNGVLSEDEQRSGHKRGHHRGWDDKDKD